MKITNKIKITFVCIIVFFAFLIFGGRFLIRNDNVLVLKQLDKKSDIVLLMGSLTNRTLGAYELFIEMKSDHIYIMRTHMEGIELLNSRGVTIANEADLAKKALIDLGLSEDDVIIIDGDTESTLDEANVLANYFTSNSHTNNLIITTSAYHGQRAGWIFDKVFSKMDINVLVSPTPYDDFDEVWWFTDREQAADVLLEYVKLLHFGLIEQW